MQASGAVAFRPSPRHPFCLHLLTYGVPLQVRSDDDALLARMAACLPPGAAVLPDTLRNPLQAPASPPSAIFTLLRPSSTAGYRFRLGNRTILHSDAPEPIIDRLRSYLILHAGEHSPERVFVHAGVVAWQGRAILLPGRSFAGKSTLVAELVSRGAIYYSDEYALVDRDGLIHPYAQDLQMRTPGGVEQHNVPVSDLCGTVGQLPIRAGLVLFTAYKPGARWRPKPLSPANAVLQMLRHTVSVRRAPAIAMQSLTRMMDGAVAVQSGRSEVREAADALLETAALLAGPVPSGSSPA